jgi:transposase
LIKLEGNLVNFYLPDPIDLDNNLAELKLPLALTKGKVCGGSVSMERLQHTANLLTVIQTCHPQALSLIEFFDQPIKAMVNSALHIPSLIPNPSSFDLNPYPKTSSGSGGTISSGKGKSSNFRSTFAITRSRSR